MADLGADYINITGMVISGKLKLYRLCFATKLGRKGTEISYWVMMAKFLLFFLWIYRWKYIIVIETNQFSPK